MLFLRMLTVLQDHLLMVMSFKNLREQSEPLIRSCNILIPQVQHSNTGELRTLDSSQMQRDSNTAQLKLNFHMISLELM